MAERQQPGTILGGEAVQQEIAGERLFLANVNAEGKGARVLLQLQ